MGLFRAMKQVMTGEVIQRIDTEIHGGWTTMSLRLKRDGNSGELYVVAAGVSGGWLGGNFQYFAFERDEFRQFASAVESIRTSLLQLPQPKV
jgi:hypothetical protein